MYRTCCRDWAWAGPAKAVALELAGQLTDLRCRVTGNHSGIGATALRANRRRLTSRPEILRVIETISRILRKKKSK